MLPNVICQWYDLVPQAVEKHTRKFFLRHIRRFLRKVTISSTMGPGVKIDSGTGLLTES